MAPIANFEKIINGLSVTFTDSSFYLPTQWSWNFGDGSPLSTQQNPQHTYAAEGTYNVVLTVSNADGSNTKAILLVLSIIPTVGNSILELVNMELPSGITLDSATYQASIKKWQLFLQPLVSPEIVDADVFNESKWPPLVNVLISKLIIWELINHYNRSYSFILNSNTPSILSPNTVQVADYQVLLNNPFSGNLTMTLAKILVNNNTINLVTPISSITQLLAQLNSLGIGYWTYQSNLLKTLGNNNNIVNFQYTLSNNSSTTLSFTSSNTQVVQISNPSPSSPQEVTPSGFIKYIEVGPSKVEYFDKSEYLKAIFMKGGLMESIQNEICGYAQRLGIKLPMCNLVTSTPLFEKVIPSNGYCNS